MVEPSCDTCCLPLPSTGAEGTVKRRAEQQTRALYDILSCVRDVRKRSDRTDAMFDPLKEATALLQQFGIHLGDGVIKQLENAEFRLGGQWHQEAMIIAIAHE